MENNQSASPKNENKRKTIRPGMWITALLLCFSIIFSAVTLIVPPKDFSDKENRKLASRPEFSKETLIDGTFFKNAQAYFADHFTGRDFWITMNLRFKTLLGQKENGGVYIGKNNTLFLKPSEPNDAALKKNLEAMNAFIKDKKIKSYAAIIPNAVTVNADKLPDNAPVPDQAEQLSYIAENIPAVDFIDVTPALTAHKDDYIFYRTDHHWTSLGAKYAFEAIAADMGIKPKNDYKTYMVSDSFTGTLASKSGKYSTADKVEIYVPQTDIEYNVTFVDNKEKTATMYKESALEGKDHYTVFFGGNHPRVDIKTTADTGRKLLVFKDSYANCLMQFMYPYFDEIIMIDPRYYYDSAYPLLNQYSITDVLYLYNCDTFMTDTSLADALDNEENSAQAIPEAEAQKAGN